MLNIPDVEEIPSPSADERAAKALITMGIGILLGGPVDRSREDVAAFIGHEIDAAYAAMEGVS